VTTIWFQDAAELAKHRRELGFSQQRLGELAGLSRSAVRNVERGQTKLRGERAQRLWHVICDEKEKRERCNNVFAARMRGEEPWPVATGEISLRFDDLQELIQELLSLRTAVEELPALRARLAELAIDVQRLNERTHKAVAVEGARILAETI
jgi:transcriptional regulator with XRE-family HTH domain